MVDLATLCTACRTIYKFCVTHEVRNMYSYSYKNGYITRWRGPGTNDDALIDELQPQKYPTAICSIPQFIRDRVWKVEILSSYEDPNVNITTFSNATHFVYDFRFHEEKKRHLDGYLRPFMKFFKFEYTPNTMPCRHTNLFAHPNRQIERQLELLHAPTKIMKHLDPARVYISNLIVYVRQEKLSFHEDDPVNPNTYELSATFIHNCPPFNSIVVDFVSFEEICWRHLDSIISHNRGCQRLIVWNFISYKNEFCPWTLIQPGHPRIQHDCLLKDLVVCDQHQGVTLRKVMLYFNHLENLICLFTLNDDYGHILPTPDLKHIRLVCYDLVDHEDVSVNVDNVYEKICSLIDIGTMPALLDIVIVLIIPTLLIVDDIQTSENNNIIATNDNNLNKPHRNVNITIREAVLSLQCTSYFTSEELKCVTSKPTYTLQ